MLFSQRRRTTCRCLKHSEIAKWYFLRFIAHCQFYFLALFYSLQGFLKQDVSNVLLIFPLASKITFYVESRESLVRIIAGVAEINWNHFQLKAKPFFSMVIATCWDQTIDEN